MSYTNDGTARTRGHGAIAARDLGKIDLRHPDEGSGGAPRAPKQKKPLFGTVQTSKGPVVVSVRPPPKQVSPHRRAPLFVTPAQRWPSTGMVNSYGNPPTARPGVIVQPSDQSWWDKRRPGTVTAAYPDPPGRAPVVVSTTPGPTKVSPFVNGASSGSGGSSSGPHVAGSGGSSGGSGGSSGGPRAAGGGGGGFTAGAKAAQEAEATEMMAHEDELTAGAQPAKPPMSTAAKIALGVIVGLALLGLTHDEKKGRHP